MFVGKVLVFFWVVLLFLRRAHTIHKRHVFILLFAVWSFAFLYSPYWYAFGTFGYPNLRYVGYLLMLLAGLFWVYLSASELELPKIQIHTGPLLSLGFVLYVLNYKQLHSDIAWRGDEGFNVTTLLRLKEYLTFFWEQGSMSFTANPIVWIFGLLLVVVFFTFRNKNTPLYQAFHLGSIVLLIIIPSLTLFFDSAFTNQKNIFLLSDVLSYPYIQKWANFFFLVPNFYDISHFRIVPFISFLGIACFLYYFFYSKLHSKLLAYFFTLAFSTVPLLLFYSSLLYLEMPALLLMIICVWNIKFLILANFDRLRRHYAWYALLFMSFVKETASIFLLTVIVLRAYNQVKIAYRKNTLSRAFIMRELRLVVVVLSPVIIFIFFRKMFIPYFDASHSFHLDKLLSISNYFVMFQALINQIGILPILGVLGLMYHAKKDALTSKSITLIFVILLFFFLTYLNSAYIFIVGYSRWNLYLLPIILFTSATSCILLVKKRRMYASLVIVIIFVFNFILFPFHSDGTRLSNWGAPLIDVGEYTYPYNDAFRFLSTQTKTQELLLLGLYSPYFGLRFYLEKYDFRPLVHVHYLGLSRFDEVTERQKLDQFFKTLPYSADTILYHSVNNIDLDKNRLYGGKYIVAKRVQNFSNSLYIFIEKMKV